jgi:hypothetical protein
MRAALLAALLAAAPLSAGTSGLRGHVRIGPLTPVCRVGVPCDGPAKNVSLSFTRAGRVTRTTTDAAGAYRVQLTAGYYTVQSSRGLSIRPRRVHVVAGGIRLLDFTIDTGIR